MAINIIHPKDPDGKSSSAVGTIVTNSDGTKISGVEHISIDMSIENFTTATIRVAVSNVTGLENIHALLDTETLEQIAEMHGKRLVDIDG